MSREEQHQIIGRTVLEHAEAQRALGALKAKAAEYAARLRPVLNYLADPKEPIPVNAIEHSPDRAELMALCGEIRDMKMRVDELAALLREMGAA